MTQKTKKITTTVLFIVLGMAAGLAYWRFVGCSSGSCAITSKWHTMLLFGGVFGYLIGDSIKWKGQGKKEVNETTDSSSTQ